jgi:hypothetical protein
VASAAAHRERKMTEVMGPPFRLHAVVATQSGRKQGLLSNVSAVTAVRWPAWYSRWRDEIELRIDAKSWAAP